MRGDISYISYQLQLGPLINSLQQISQYAPHYNNVLANLDEQDGFSHSCARNINLGEIRSVSFGWTVVDAAFFFGGNYEFGGIWEVGNNRGVRPSHKMHKIYHTGAYQYGLNMSPKSGNFSRGFNKQTFKQFFNLDTGLNVGLWCHLVPPNGMSKSFGITLGGARKGGLVVTVWFDGSISNPGYGDGIRLAGISISPQIGYSTEFEMQHACTNSQFQGGTFGQLTPACEN